MFDVLLPIRINRSHGRLIFPLQRRRVSDKCERVSYGLQLFLYWLVGAALVVGLVLWIAHLGLLINLIFAFSAAYLWVILGRRIFNRPEGL